MIFRWFCLWLICWTELLDGLTGVLTLGFFRPDWLSLRACSYLLGLIEDHSPGEES